MQQLDLLLNQTNTERGYSFAELLLSVVVIGALASIVTVAVRDLTAEASQAGCDVDARQIHLAAMAYLEGERVETIPVSGDDPDGYERTLVQAGYLRELSSRFDVDVDGSLIVQEDSPC